MHSRPNIDLTCTCNISFYTTLYMSVYSFFFQDDAKKAYIALVEGLAGKDAPVEASSEPTGKYETLKVSSENGIFRITLNRPTKKNAINYQVSMTRFKLSLCN